MIVLPGTTDDAPFGDFLSREKFAEYSKYGCGFCSSHVDYHDKDITVIERLDLVLCPSCSPRGRTRVLVPASRMPDFEDLKKKAQETAPPPRILLAAPDAI